MKNGSLALFCWKEEAKGISSGASKEAQTERELLVYSKKGGNISLGSEMTIKVKI